MNEKLVEVFRTRGEGPAQIIKGMLESNGIPCLLKSNAAPSVFPFTVDGMGEYMIMVRSEDAADSLRLIESRDEGPGDVVPPEGESG